MRKTDSIISAGIDIGTSTSHLTISRLHFANVSAGNRIAKLAINAREIIYRSAIYETPLNEDSSINAGAVAALLEREYDRAGYTAGQIQTGAVIVTGESAKLRNARELALSVAGLAGDFVVASAGPDLESLIAGKGSGAEEYSRRESKVICNIDIGGGTCNYAVFDCGRLIDTACLAIGGRCIRFNDRGEVCKFTDSGETFLDGVAKLQLLPLNCKADMPLLELIANLLAEVILHAASSMAPPQIVQRLLINKPLRHDYKIDEFLISGGVAECMQMTDLVDNPFAFRDMGVLLGEALKEALAERLLAYRLSPQGIRATVIGAGMHSLQLSGCTVMVAEDLLPLRNLRILRPFLADDAGLESSQIGEKLRLCLTELEQPELAAIAVCDLSKLSYEELKNWARTILFVHRQYRADSPLIILSQEDIGLALGQTIKQLDDKLELIVLDGVDLSCGDYIDIARPVKGGMAVPLTVKTLIFGY